MDKLPKVSILTPTYDRRRFLEMMVANLYNMKYPKELLEWVICDSYSTTGHKAEQLFKNKNEQNELSSALGIEIRYEYLDREMSIGEKRNWLVKNSKYDVLINMDSDDIYLPDYVFYSVGMLKFNKRTLVGSPQMLFIYPLNDYKMTFINCPSLRQIHEATFCFTRKHFRKMGGFLKSGNGEGAGMVDGCRDKDFEKTDISKCMVCICHEDNTCPKDKFLKDELLVDLKMDGDQFRILRKMFQKHP